MACFVARNWSSIPCFKILLDNDLIFGLSFDFFLFLILARNCFLLGMVCLAMIFIIIPSFSTSVTLLILSFCFYFLLLLLHAVDFFLLLLGLDLLIFIFFGNLIVIKPFLIGFALIGIAGFSLRLGAIFISNKLLVASQGLALGFWLIVTRACSLFFNWTWLLFSVISNVSGAAADFVFKVVRRLRSGIFTGLMSDLLFSFCLWTSKWRRLCELNACCFSQLS